MPERLLILASGLVAIACACTDSWPGYGVFPSTDVESIIDAGVVPRPPEHSGRDVGFSYRFRGRSVWIFGDTFLPRKADDGLRWRSSSWSWTHLTDDNGIGPFEHALAPDGLAIQLLPHTSEEASYNLAHDGHEDCLAKMDCGSRRTPWPGALVTDASEQHGIIFYRNMETGPGGQWDFRSVSASVAMWSDPEAPARRIEPPLFGAEEPGWGDAAVMANEHIFVYACEMLDDAFPCRLARVPFHSAATRDNYLFWAGSEVWSEDWRKAVPVLDGAPLFSVHYNRYLEKYVAFYLAGISDVITLRTAPHPQGPWSKASSIGKTMPAHENWSYALNAHPEFARENGRVEILSYTRPEGFLQQEIRLIELRFR